MLPGCNMSREMGEVHRMKKGKCLYLVVFFQFAGQLFHANQQIVGREDLYIIAPHQYPAGKVFQWVIVHEGIFYLVIIADLFLYQAVVVFLVAQVAGHA